MSLPSYRLLDGADICSGAFPISASETNLAMARDFVFRKWTERAAERGNPVPTDLSGSCKFSSLFAASVFGAQMHGNSDHQFCRLPSGQILDLNADAADVKALKRPWRHDRGFWNNPDHRDAMDSCGPRVDRWLADFAAELAERSALLEGAAEPDAGECSPA